MSGSTTNLDLISASQASKEVTANDLFDAASPATIYGRRATTTAALTWGFYGGTRIINGVATTIANGTVALTANLTNYVEANRATGAVTANTAGFTAGTDPLYTIVAGASTVTSYTDNRSALTPVGFLSKSVAAGGTITLSNAESNNHLFEFIGVLPNNTTVVFPATPGRLQCENLTTGAFSLTVKTAAGTGIVIQQNSTLNLYCNGVNIEDSNSAKEDDINRDASGGYVGKTLEKINFWNTARTFMSFLVNAATAIRTYTFPDRDGTVALKDDAGMWSGTTGGTTTAYTLTPSPAITTYADGQRFLFIAHATNTGAGATFAVSGLAALPSTMGSVTMPIGGLLINNKYWGLVEGTGTSIRIAPFDAVSSNGDTINGAAAFEVNGDALIIGTEASKVREGSWATASGALYTLLGDTAAWYRTHNTALTGAGDFAGRDDIGICQLWAVGESGREYYYEAVSAAAGVVPTFVLTYGQVNHQVAQDVRGQTQGVQMTLSAGAACMSSVSAADLNFGTTSFSIALETALPLWNGSALNTFLVHKYQDASNSYYLISAATTGLLALFIGSTGATSVSVASTIAPPLIAGAKALVEVLITRETASVAGSVIFMINGVRLGAEVTIPLAATPASATNTGAIDFLGRVDSGTKYASTTSLCAMFNYALTVAQAAEFYRNGLPFSDAFGSQTGATSGLLIIGRRYRITIFVAGDVFTNVGAASNATGVEFIATGTTPTTWVNASTLNALGATVYWSSENIQYDGWYNSAPSGLTLTYPTSDYRFNRPPTNVGFSGTPFAGTGTATLTIAQLMTKLLSDTHATAATATYTLPLATSIDAIPSWPIGLGIEWSFTNLSAAAADTATIAANTGHTVVGNMVIQSANAATGALYGNTRRFLTKKTAISAAGVGTYITYVYGG